MLHQGDIVLEHWLAGLAGKHYQVGMIRPTSKQRGCFMAATPPMHIFSCVTRTIVSDTVMQSTNSTYHTIPATSRATDRQTNRVVKPRRRRHLNREEVSPNHADDPLDLEIGLW